MRVAKQKKEFTEHEKLFTSLADGVSHTFLQLTRLSEEARFIPGSQDEQWAAVRDLTGASLQLLESYVHLMRLHGGTAQPLLEPVAVTSLLYDTLHMLEPYAKQYQVDLAIDIPPSLEPVVSDRAILQSALLSLGQVFIGAQSESEHEQRVLSLGAHKGRYGIVAGWYGQGYELSARALTRARRLHGRVQQPLHELVSGSASGVFIADGLLASISSQLHVARYHNTAGLAATLPACHQLQLV
ncbi:hypothetical protein IPL85_03575 [Candidatus Saccharibacteria bacterium]|nr:MAG: hypothetical protein IPL85_03575 [Candidatus Saccharibacteria bacterium]